MNRIRGLLAGRAHCTSERSDTGFFRWVKTLLYDLGQDPPNVIEFIDEFNRTRVHPPKSQADVMRTVRFIMDGKLKEDRPRGWMLNEKPARTYRLRK